MATRYASIEDVRAEGITKTQADNDRVWALIEEMSDLVDRLTGWWFEARGPKTYKLDGTGTKWLHLPAPVIAVTQVRRMFRGSAPDQSLILAADDYVVYDREEDRFNPKLQLITGHTGRFVTAATSDPFRHVAKFHRGALNYEVDATLGFVDDPGVSNKPPDQIRRAVIMLIVHYASPLATAPTDDEFQLRSGNLTKLQVRGRTAEWGGGAQGGGGQGSIDAATGVPEVDRILSLYRSPIGVKAA